MTDYLAVYTDGSDTVIRDAYGYDAAIARARRAAYGRKLVDVFEQADEIELGLPVCSHHTVNIHTRECISCGGSQFDIAARSEFI